MFGFNLLIFVCLIALALAILFFGKYRKKHSSLSLILTIILFALFLLLLLMVLKFVVI